MKTEKLIEEAEKRGIALVDLFANYLSINEDVLASGIIAGKEILTDLSRKDNDK